MKKTRDQDLIEYLSRRLYDGFLNEADRKNLRSYSSDEETTLQMVRDFDRVLDHAAGENPPDITHVGLEQKTLTVQFVCPYFEGRDNFQGRSLPTFIANSTDFASDAVDYMLRHQIHATDFAECINRLMVGDELVTVDNQFAGLLRAAALRSPDGGEETLLAVDHRTPRYRFVFLISILDERIDSVLSKSRVSPGKNAINNAVAQFIATCRKKMAGNKPNSGRH